MTRRALAPRRAGWAVACALGLGLGGLACNEAPPAPASPEATPSPAPADPSPAPPHGDVTIEPEPVPVPVPIVPVPVPSKPSAGGLADLTRELVADARRKASDPPLLLPDAAHFVLTTRPAELLAQEQLGALWATAEGKNAEMALAMDVVRACLGRLEAFERLAIGWDDQGHAAVVGRAKGLGTEAMWTCLRDQTKQRGKPFELELTKTPRGEGPQLRESDGEDLGYFVDDDTVVLLSREWDAEVSPRLRGEGTPALEGQLAPAAGRVSRDAPLWLVGRVSEKTARGMAGSPTAGVTDLALSITLPDGDLQLHFDGDAGEPADATRVRDELTTQLESIRSVLPVMGLPASVGPKIAFETEGDLVSLRLLLTREELRGLVEFVARTF